MNFIELQFNEILTIRIIVSIVNIILGIEATWAHESWSSTL